MCIMLTSYEHEVEPVTVDGAERAARCAPSTFSSE